MPMSIKSLAAVTSLSLLPLAAEAFAPPGRVATAHPPFLRHRRPSASASSVAGAAANVDAADDPTSDGADDDGANGECGVLLLDHLNVNHEKGRQDLVKAFYFDFLGCAIDPRKYENYVKGTKTLWANIGMQQFHLPEGKPDAQVFEGMITLIYDDLDGLMERYHSFLDGDERFEPLKESEFLVGSVDDGEMLLVTDPWGSQFCVLPSDDPIEDRAAHVGAQPVLEGHGPSAGLAMEDLTVHVPHDTNLAGIGRFYAHVLGAPTVEELTTEESISVAMGERQTLTFRYHPDGPSATVAHHDFSYDDEPILTDLPVESLPTYPSNHGPHVSLYVTNLSSAYRKAEELGATYVNPRFKRRAYTEEEALDQCMFRIIDICDPLDEKREVIVRLEHEVRSAKKRDGTKYKSCPLLEV